MNTLKPLKLKEPGLAYGVISGFPIHDSYPIEDRERLDELFREYYFAWKAMSWAAISRFAANRSNAETSVGPSPFSHYRVNGWWEYEGRRIVDNGFILFGSSDALHDFMKGYNRPYILKTETETETASLFSDQGSEADIIYVGDLEDWREIISRVYGFLRPGSVFRTYKVAEFAGSFPIPGSTSLGILSGTCAKTESQGRLRAKPLPLIDASEAGNHLRKHLQVRGTVTEIEANRRGDVILRFGSQYEVLRAIVPASCSLSKEREWIDSLRDRTLTVTGLISFYAQEPAMRILEKNQIHPQLV